MDKIKRSFSMTLTDDDLVLCYNKGKGLYLWSMESESIITSTSKLSVSHLCFSGDGKEIAAATENPSSIVVYKTNQLDKPYFRYKFSSMFIPQITCIKNTNTFFAGCHDSIYYIDPANNIVKKVYQTDDGYCKYLTYNNSKVFVVYDRIKPSKYSSTCIELLVKKSEFLEETSITVNAIGSYDFCETIIWFVENPKREKYVAVSGLNHKICFVDEKGTIKNVYELPSLIERAFVSGDNGIAGILMQEGEKEVIKLISLNQNAKQLYEYKESGYICYPSISNSGNYLLIPHTKESKIISIKD